MPEPFLTTYDARKPRGLVLMLHGGTGASREPVDGRSLSWQRTRLMARTIAPRARRRDVSVWVLRFRERGWNRGAPVEDAREALGVVRRRLGDLPVVLLGHSMGGRTAAHAADDPSVTGVVGLAPWFQPDTPVRTLTGKRLVAAHGTVDRITSARMTQSYVARVGRVAEQADFVDMGPVGHYMLKRLHAWNDLALTSSLEMLDQTS